MAIPVLTHVLRGRYDDVHKNSGDAGGELSQRERAEFGWDHAEVGSWMCESWSFPQGLTECIAGHHDDEDGSDAPLAVRAVSLLPSEGPSHEADEFVSFVEEGSELSSDELRSIVEVADLESEELGRLFC